MRAHENNVAAFLLHNGRPDQVALLAGDCSHTYGDLARAAQKLSNHLLQLGCAKGDRFVLIGENSLFWVVAYCALLAAGLVCVPLPPDIAIEDLQFVLEETESTGALLDSKLAARFGPSLRRLHLVTDRLAPKIDGVQTQAAFSDLRESPEEQSFEDVEGNDLAALMFTSGSTGRPRGVMVSHGNIIANTDSIIEYLQLTDTDRIMTVLPFHYCFGTSLLHTHLRAGGSLVLDQRFLYPEKILERMIETGCTGFAGVPSHFQILLRRSTIAKKAFPCLRYVQQAGGHLPPTFIRELQEALPGKQIFVMYGQTEATARLSYLPPNLIDTKPGSIGKGIPGVRLRVLDAAHRDVGPGEVGEIVAEGDNVALGYWRAPAETELTFRDGKLYTGDIATVDHDGYIYIVDRAKDFVKVAGKRVSCRQLEDKLMECGDVIEAAIVAVPDEILGEAIKAFVVPRTPDCDGLKETLYQACKRTMPPEFVPKQIVLVQSLPKNSAGKVLKHDLRAS